MHDTAILAALDAAIRAEIEGCHFYEMAAAVTADPDGRRAFLTLAQEERHHAEFLRAQWASLSVRGEIDAAATLGAPPVAAGFFSPALRTRATTAHFEMTALSVGAQLEADAQRFYRDEAERTSDPSVKDFLLRLAEWEAGHYRALVAEQQALQEEYWSANRFAAF